MFGKIKYIGEGSIVVETNEEANKSNILNLHVVIYDKEKFILGEVSSVGEKEAKINLLGEFEGANFRQGILRKPNFQAETRAILKEEIPLILGVDSSETLLLGRSPLYNGHSVYFNLNNFFSNHFAIIGNSGSGKSWAIARLIQNVFSNPHIKPYRSNFIFFDVSGEYTKAFSSLKSIDPNYNYRVLTTGSSKDTYMEGFKIPIHLLGVNGLAMLLQVSSTSQIPIIKQMVKYARIFAEQKEDETYINHILASAILKVLYSESSPSKKKNDAIALIMGNPTKAINSDTDVPGIGYTRKFHECFYVDKHGTFTEGNILTEYIQKFIKPELDNYEPNPNTVYNLEHLRKALQFTLITDGWYNNPNTYGDAALISVRFNDIINGPYKKIFEIGASLNKEQYLSSLLIKGSNKYQILNINLEDTDDWFASVITKVFAGMILEYTKSLAIKGSVPFHMIVDEAHRYIKKNDPEQDIYGYNIFERVAKEGRKFGTMLGIITQRPVELSDTVISQCSNFLIFRTNHPLDAKYVRDMVPNISEEIAEKQKTLQSGTCIAFGSAFKIPVITTLEKPNPEPLSSNSDVSKFWTYNTK